MKALAWYVSPKSTQANTLMWRLPNSTQSRWRPVWLLRGITRLWRFTPPSYSVVTIN
ncbi:Uncharacterised protein [Vibrio cholerae]|nr:Uncharacterised protein [Vibrio cholerae]CSI72139.1 Uncharacterised protein [Vibrio cholerae]